MSRKTALAATGKADSLAASTCPELTRIE